MAVVKELCARFPTVSYHASGMLLAVGSVAKPYAVGRRSGMGEHGADADGGGGTTMEVFDMQTGNKTNVLHLRCNHLSPTNRKPSGRQVKKKKNPLLVKHCVERMGGKY